MKIQRNVSYVAIAAGMGLTVVAADHAQATEGYFQHGYGVRGKALAGAGIADGRDSTILATNPAGIINLEGSELNVGFSVFSPRRDFTTYGNPGITPDGTTVSGENYFVIPDFSYAKKIDENTAWGISVTANGGMNTEWPDVPRALMECGGGSGIFCGGAAGVDLSQALIAATYAKRFDRITIGIAPIIGFQMFEAKGLGAFAGFSSDPSNLTDKGHDTALGWGFRFGFQVEVTDGVRLGGAYQSRIRMGKFNDYAGLFADQGDFDVPRTFQVGLAIDATPDITIMADYRKIYYESIGSVGNSPTLLFPFSMMGAPNLSFGATGGPGFSWNNVDAFKVGIEWRMSADWTLRAGYANNDNPINGADTTLNILAPGVVTNHYSTGFSHRISEHSEIGAAFTYVPDKAVEGPDLFVPGRFVQIKMNQFDFTVGWKYKF